MLTTHEHPATTTTAAAHKDGGGAASEWIANYQRGSPLDFGATCRDLGSMLLERILRHDPARPAVRNAAHPESDLITYGQIAERAPRLAAGLLSEPALALKPGDVVAFFSSNVPRAAVAALAVSLAGLTVALADPRHTTQELAHLVELVEPKAIFTVPSLVAVAKAAMIDIGRSLPLVMIPDPTDHEDHLMPEGCLEMEAIIEKTPAKGVMQKLPQIDHESVALLCLSSGTTGPPKAVELRHRNLVANVHQMEQFRAEVLSRRPEIAALLPKVIAADCLLRLARIGGFFTLLSNLAQGATLFLFNDFDVPLWLQTVQRYRISSSTMVPSMVVAVAKYAELEHYDLSSIGAIVVGGAPLRAEVQFMCAKKLGVLVFQNYGCTEAAPLTHMVPFPDINPGDVSTYGTVGVAVPGIEAGLVDPETLQPVQKPGEQGELLIRGPNIFRGYRGNPKATTQTLVVWNDGHVWMRTGDIATIDERGHLKIVDRLKEVIKCDGVQVAPAELEAVLHLHPTVQDVGVIGNPDGLGDELPTAFVVLKPDALAHYSHGSREWAHEQIAEELKAFVAKNVASWKALRGGVRFIDEVPRNASGKVLRRELRKLL